MPFSEATLDFLFENRVNDSKAWFGDHRDDYDRLVLSPLRTLVEDMAPAMLSIDPLLICEPKVGRSISRIFRDTRFSRDKSVFRDVMWCVFIRDKKLYGGLPGFYMELSPRHMGWGCGYYKASAEAIDAMRDLVKNRDQTFLAMEEAYRGQSLFTLEDSRYKRTRHPEESEDLRFWLDQRNLCFTAESLDNKLLFSKDLAKTLGEQFTTLIPMYEFMMKAESRVVKQGR